MRLRNIVHLSVFGMMLAGCGTNPIQPSDQHIQRKDLQPELAGSTPEPIKGSVILPPPKPAEKVATYSVVVTNVPAQEILFALARDAKINLDIQSGIQGAVTLNAINQTLPQILSRITKQVEMRYELNNGTLTVMPDTPYLKQYKIDYVNMDRDSEGGITNTSQIGSGASSSAGASAGGGGAGGSNSSQLSIKNSSKNHFWKTLTQNIKDILHETDMILPAGSSETTMQQSKDVSNSGTGAPIVATKKKPQPKQPDVEHSSNPATLQESDTTVIRTSTFREAASVIDNPETGIITVRATSKQHEKIQEFIDQVMANARRQVMIEATIVEVRLSDTYQQGIDWSKFLDASTTKGFNIIQKGTGLTSTTAGAGTLLVNYVNPTSKFGNIAASVSLLETFGNVKVLSSPKLSVMNNQTAMLRVVDNNVWFNVNSTTTPCSPAPCTPITTYTTTVNTIQVGFTMSVTPQINDSNSVLLNVRPSITRRLPDVQDPTPNLSIPNMVPQLSTREMESMLKIENNQIAILGGLMEDSTDKQSQGIPLLGEIPILGNLFKSRNDTTKKTELVIFLRPVVIKNASVEADFSEFRSSLPDQKFFQEPVNGNP